MASPGQGRVQPRLRDSTTNNDEDRELLRSLNQLSLSTSPSQSSARFSTSPSSNAHSKLTPTRVSSASPSFRAPSRSPVNRSSSSTHLTQSRSSTPNLLRKTSMNSLHSSSGITPSRAPSRRGSSTHLLSPSASKSPLNGSVQAMEEFKEKPALTAASVASTYLQKELESLHGNFASHPSETIVVLHDACYGHRFARPRATKTELSTVVERPERIQASILGLSIAYIRLGERHSDGKYPIHPQLDPASLPNVPFHIYKTNRTLALDSTAVTHVHGTKWMEELKIMCNSAESKLASNANELHRPDMNRGQAGPPEELHKGDLYLCSESLNAFEGALGAVCDAVDQIFSDSPHKRAFVAVRPPGHHCSASQPSGFCWVNNVQVGIMHGFLNHGLTHAAIIDFDLHHGDGSQAIAWSHNRRSHTSARNASAWKRTSIGYFSIHDINSYPCESSDEEKVRNASVCIDNAHGQSIWNIHLQEWKSDVEFWKLYQSKYSFLLEKARAFLRTQTQRYRSSGQEPKAAIFLSAGFDASEWESAGMQRHKVNVPTEFYARITRDVVKMSSEEGLGVEGRVISVLEGGYSDRALYSGVLSHLSGLAGVEPMPPKEETPPGLGYEMGNRIGSYSRRNTLTENEMKLKIPGFPYDPSWWSAPELDRLDAVMTAPPLEQPKKPRVFVPGNYSSPTQASSLKAVDPAKVRRSVSGFASSQISISRPPSPPPPDVPWTIASHELSKLLIPKDRQISSIKFEELNTGVPKARRGRQSLEQNGSATDNPAAPVAPTRKSMRERKPVSYTDTDDRSRRRTVGGSTILATEKALARGIPTQNSSGPTPQLGSTSMLTTNGVAGEITRPNTSLSVRPESAMSVRSSTKLNVKKTRPAAPTRKDSRVSKKPRTTTNKAEGAPAPLAVNKESSVSSSGEAKPLKIKFSVLGKEARACQKAEAKKDVLIEDATPSHIPPKNAHISPVSHPTKAALALATLDPIRNGEESTDSRAEFGVGSPTDISSSVSPAIGEVQYFSSANVPTISTSGFLPSPSSSPEQPTTETSKDEGVFVQYQPSGPPAATMPSSRPVQILEQHTNSPSRQAGHSFTPTSSIPFAPRPVQEAHSASGEDIAVLSQHRDHDMGGVWEIPDTPQHH
ncbi:Arginase/deacetylase [Hypoxylon sp. FL0890]|nr:Arginase/deacetylase [Hypoxylon sp. FL0890]